MDLTTLEEMLSPEGVEKYRATGVLFDRFVKKYGQKKSEKKVKKGLRKLFDNLGKEYGNDVEISQIGEELNIDARFLAKLEDGKVEIYLLSEDDFSYDGFAIGISYSYDTDMYGTKRCQLAIRRPVF